MKSDPAIGQVIALLEKSLILQLHSMGVPQGDIAKMLNKGKAYINEFLKPLSNGRKK